VDAELRAELIDVATGLIPPDLLLVNARLLNVLTREIQSVDIAIRRDRIAAVTTRADGVWKAARTIDLEGRYVTPGFMDPHVHIEGSLVTPIEFSRGVVARGTTLVAQDPHEIANVGGMAGVEAMLAEARLVPLRILLRVPGRVPGYPQDLESTSGALSLDETLRLLDLPESVCLAGDYNPQWVMRGERDLLKKIERTSSLGKSVSGQPAGLRGRALSGFVAAGLEDSHVASSVDEIIENQSVGLRTTLVMRPGRRLGREHVRELAGIIAKRRLETRFIQLSTDEVNPHDLLAEGHLDQRIRLCIEEGIEVATAYQWATLNVAEGLRIDRDFGSVSPGKMADLVVLDDLESVKVRATMIGGEFIYEDGSYRRSLDRNAARFSKVKGVRLRRPLTERDFELKAGKSDGTIKVRAIVTDTPKRQEEIELPVRSGLVQPNESFSMLAMAECHGGSGGVGLAFVGGVHLSRGAIASTVSHDAHNMLIVGQSRTDMAFAANRLAEIGGGFIAVLDGRVLCELALPIAGLMSSDAIELLAEKLGRFEAVLLGELECPPASQILMRFNLLSMGNASSCGFSDKGLIDSASMETVDTILC
jgi:adenine deaminase